MNLPTSRDELSLGKVIVQSFLVIAGIIHSGLSQPVLCPVLGFSCSTEASAAWMVGGGGGGGGCRTEQFSVALRPQRP